MAEGRVPNNILFGSLQRRLKVFRSRLRWLDVNCWRRVTWAEDGSGELWSRPRRGSRIIVVDGKMVYGKDKVYRGTANYT